MYTIIKKLKYVMWGAWEFASQVGMGQWWILNYWQIAIGIIPISNFQIALIKIKGHHLQFAVHIYFIGSKGQPLHYPKLLNSLIYASLQLLLKYTNKYEITPSKLP